MNWNWWWTLRHRDDDLDEEIRAHLAMARKDRIAAGQDPRDADAAARREFGNIGLVKEVTREMWGFSWIDRVLQDMRYAVRSLRHSPGFALTAILSLALGIGANTAAFSLAEALLLRPLPVNDPARVVDINGHRRATGIQEISYPNFLDIKAQAKSYEGIVAYSTRRFAAAHAVDTVPRMVFGLLVSPEFFQTFGVQPLHGRAFTGDETSVTGREPVAVLGYDYWQSQYSGNPNAVGQTLRINGIPFTIVGVAPESFTGVDRIMRHAIYVPATMVDRLGNAIRGVSVLAARGQASFQLRARLRPGISVSEANAEATTIGAALRRAFPDVNKDLTFTARTELQARAQDSPPAIALIVLLSALAALVLVIACVNVANLLLARSLARAREIAIRLAVGAGRRRLFQQLITESAVLAVLGCGAGIGLSYWAIRYLSAIRLPTDTPLQLSTQLDHRVLIFSLAVAAISAIAFGAIPAWRTAKADLTPALKSGGEVVQARGRNIGRSALVSAQVALCMVLLVASFAMLDAFRRMVLLDPGIRTNNVMMMEFDPALVRYSNEQSVEFFKQLAARTRELPGVRSATLSRAMPFRPNFNDHAVVPEGYQFPRDQTSVTVAANVVDEAYFDTLGTPILHGRAFTTSDRESSQRVVIVNEEFAKRYWQNQNPLGKRLRFPGGAPDAVVIGVARTSRYLSLMETPTPYIYLPFAQSPQTRMTLFVHTAGQPENMTRPILDVVRSLDANQPVFNVYSMDEFYSQGALGVGLVVLQMVGVAGTVGLLLAVVGLYGLVAYTVNRRTREIGVRMAIGAGRLRVLALVLRQGLTLSLVGIAAGLALSVPVFRLLASALAGLGSLSPLTLVVVPLGLILITLSACFVPARRAARIDPTTALRAD